MQLATDTASIMSVDVSPQRELWLLNQEIDQLELELSAKSSERRTVAKQAASATRRYRYLTFLQRLRGPAAKYELWQMGVMLTGALVWAHSALYPSIS